MIYINSDIPKDNEILLNVLASQKEYKYFDGDLSSLKDRVKEDLIITTSPKVFLKDCPGTNFYRCCDYKVLHFGDNCPFECTYCILNAYFDKESNVVYADVDKMVDEVALYLETHEYLRLGTGEFTDSLAYEDVTRFSEVFLKKCFARVDVNRFNVELKTKSLNIDNLLGFKEKESILFAWSLNAYSVWDNDEKFTPSSIERLKKAKMAVDAGFKVSFHFDPIININNFKEEYSAIIEKIFKYIPPERIAFISLGSFRFIPMLKNYILKKYPESMLIKTEFIHGIDGKLRYPYSTRIEMYKYVVDLLKAKGVTLYYCMESEKVWLNTIGFFPESDEDLGDILWKSIKK